ncbi:hypothetical protein A3A37_00300 [Candidatus Kaiserbacteria bacterium RIFCSPLOWO2_01_FULL_52_36]|nr:MAG: hypothetical protein A3A37_00300 [Candidatus Kaiserbacteria bacterium RIFCSPLOWO2_01_FULL_52_36]
MSEDKKLDDILKERLAALPAPVRDAIRSADVEKGLRELADRHKLHLDQWQTLENEVMLSLIGLEPIDKLEENIMSEVGVDAETARVLASDIAGIVFEPIRAKLESALGAPLESGRGTETEEKEGTKVPLSDVRGMAPSEYSVPQNVLAATPATPPAPPPMEKAQRAPVSPLYAPQEKSHERKDIEGDPYREQVS